MEGKTKQTDKQIENNNTSKKFMNSQWSVLEKNVKTVVKFKKLSSEQSRADHISQMNLLIFFFDIDDPVITSCISGPTE